MKLNRKQYVLLILGFSEACLLLLSNFLAGVIWGFDLPLPGEQTFQFVQDGGVLTFPLIYIITDLIVELYGHKIANQVAATTSWINVGALAFCALASFLPVIPDTGSEIVQQVLSVSARISFASILAFYIGQLVNNYCFDWIRKRTGQSAFWKRSLGSSLAGRFVDTIIFNVVAFIGYSPLPVLLGQIIWALIVPTILEACLNPITKFVARKLAPQMEKADL